MIRYLLIILKLPVFVIVVIFYVVPKSFALEDMWLDGCGDKLWEDAVDSERELLNKQYAKLKNWVVGVSR